MHFRKRSVKSEKTSEDGEMPDQVVTGTENPDKMPIVDRIALNNAIAELPNGYRSVFVLHDIEGYTHAEIGEMLGIAEGTSKARLFDARNRLRKALAAYAPRE